MRWIITLILLPAPLWAQDDHDHPKDGFNDASLLIESMDQLRDLAEIDGDPATFTADEQMKFAILGQLLGIDADAPVQE